jgi:hypothetical protein
MVGQLTDRGNFNHLVFSMVGQLTDRGDFNHLVFPMVGQLTYRGNFNHLFHRNVFMLGTSLTVNRYTELSMQNC